jgi:hypothetical protein
LTQFASLFSIMRIIFMPPSVAFCSIISVFIKIWQNRWKLEWMTF